jgi:hypothetical protein
VVRIPLALNSSGVRLDSETVVDRASQSLFASKGTLRRLDRDVPQEESNLIQFAASQVTKPRTRATEVVRYELLDASAPCSYPDHIPEHLRRHARTPDAAGLVDGAENRTVRNVDSMCPGIDRIFDPAWDRHRGNVATLSD